MLKPTDKEIVDLIKELPKTKERKPDTYVKIILGKFQDFRIKNQTIWMYKEGYYDTFESKLIAKNGFIRQAIEHMIGERATAAEVDMTYHEIINQYSSFKEFSSDETALNVNNMIVIFGNKSVRIANHSRDYFFTYKLGYDYEPNAECELFDKVVSDAFSQEETIFALQEFLGYMFMKKMNLNLEKMVYLNGRGANGKSVILDVITLLIHESNVSHVELKNFSKENNLVAMKGKLLNIGSDSTGKGVATDVLKKIVSGERIEARSLYQDVETLHVLPKLIFAVNQMPSTADGDSSYGYQRRLLIFPFKKIIPIEKRDKHLVKKLSKELSGILNWAIEGYECLLEQGEFTHSDEMQEALREYELQLNNIEYFLSEHYIYTGKNSRTSHQNLYDIYQQWCRKSGVRAVSKNELVGNIRSLNKYEEYKNNSIKGFKLELATQEKRKEDKHYSEMTDEELFGED